MVLTWLALVFFGMISFLFKDTIWFAENIDLVSWYIVFFTSIIFLTWVFFKYKDSTILTIIYVGYLLRILLLIWDINFQHVFTLPGSGYDTEMFYARALRMFYQPEVHAERYSALVFRIFQLFGPQRIIAQYINLLLGMNSVIIAVNIVKQYKKDKNTEMIILLFGLLMPYFAIMNVLLLREALIVFFIISSLYFYILWFKDGKSWGIVMAVTCILLASTQHSGSFAIAIGYAIGLIFYDRKSKSFHFKLKSISWILISFLFVYVIDYIFGSTVFGQFQRIEGIGDLLTFAEEGLGAFGGADYTVFINTGTEILDFIVNTPIRMLYFVLSPFPWYWRGPLDIIAFVFSSLFNGLFYYTAFKAIKTNEDREVLLLLLLTSIACTFIFGWGVRNIGTAMRHRDKFLLLNIIMYSMCVPGLRRRRNWR